MHKKRDVVTWLSLFTFLQIKIRAENEETFRISSHLQSVAIQRDVANSFGAGKLFTYGDVG